MSNEQTAPIGAQPEDAVLDAAPETADAPAGDASAQEAPAAQPEREETPAGYVVNPEKNEVIEVDREQVDYIDVSPKMMVSIATAMIPFWEKAFFSAPLGANGVATEWITKSQHSSSDAKPGFYGKL